MGKGPQNPFWGHEPQNHLDLCLLWGMNKLEMSVFLLKKCVEESRPGLSGDLATPGVFRDTCSFHLFDQSSFKCGFHSQAWLMVQAGSWHSSHHIYAPSRKHELRPQRGHVCSSLKLSQKLCLLTASYSSFACPSQRESRKCDLLAGNITT